MRFTCSLLHRLARAQASAPHAAGATVEADLGRRDLLLTLGAAGLLHCKHLPRIRRHRRAAGELFRPKLKGP